MKSTGKTIRTKTVATILICMGCLYACRNSKAPEEPVTLARTPVTVVNPAIGDISDSIDFPAIATYLKRNVIRSSTSGVVESVNIVQGGNAEKGSLAFSVRTKEAAVLKNAQPSDSSLGIKGLVKILSPRDGVVSSVSHQAGDYVQEGDELAVVADVSSMAFILEVPYEMAASIKPNTNCSLVLPDFSRLTGRITGRFPEMDKQNQTISFKVEAGNLSKIPENLIASGLLIRSEKKNAQVLPRQALLGNETQTLFWVMKMVNDSTAVRVDVKKGIENGNVVEIMEPIFGKDDRILSSGNYGLPDTAAVIISK